MTRLVRHAIGDGWIDVTARAYSVPEALALESALKQAPPAQAFQPVAPPATTVADHATPTEDALPPAALADPEDTTEGLNCETRAVVG